MSREQLQEAIEMMTEFDNTLDNTRRDAMDGIKAGESVLYDENKYPEAVLCLMPVNMVAQVDFRTCFTV